jgi:hypothetical protein
MCALNKGPRLLMVACHVDERTKSKSIAIKMLLSYNNGVTLYHECYPQIMTISCLCERECGNGWWSAVVKLCDLVEIFSL